MPELPDLEVFKENIYKKLTSKRLVGVTVYNPRKITAPQSFLTQELAGRELAAINRFGKELLFDFGDGRVIAAHLMLSGRVSIVRGESAAVAIRFGIFLGRAQTRKRPASVASLFFFYRKALVKKCPA